MVIQMITEAMNNYGVCIVATNVVRWRELMKRILWGEFWLLDVD